MFGGRIAGNELFKMQSKVVAGHGRQVLKIRFAMHVKEVVVVFILRLVKRRIFKGMLDHVFAPVEIERTNIPGLQFFFGFYMRFVNFGL